MGQKPSHMGQKLPFSWIFTRDQTTCHPNPEQPIKFQYKTRRKQQSNNTKACNNTNSIKTINNLIKNVNEVKCKKTENFVVRTKSEPNLASSGQHRRERHRKKNRRENWKVAHFGYEIQDVDGFLTTATIEKPANIPVVLAFPSTLYQTRFGGYQDEINLPLGMVVNAVFKNQRWLYVQTPHAEEGYVNYAACLPLGIIPPPDDNSPCWEKSTDVFPKPSGNMTDTEKLSSKSEYSSETCRRSRTAFSEKSVDGLYLKAAKRHKHQVRQTLLVITCDFFNEEQNALDVRQGDVVVLLGTHVKGWFWVRNKNGKEGFIPAAIAGHGFL